jgi:hypothetical protein
MQYASGLVLEKVYANSALALLNNRVEIVGGRNTQVNDWDTFGADVSVLRDETSEPGPNATGASNLVIANGTLEIKVRIN